MLLWIVISVIVPYSYGQIREAEYECGAHGRFEYCIDGIPGCVVGCHCHPGYYFDTYTKICEPNIKLTQNFRRNYDLSEPTRIYLLPTPAVVEEPATTVKNAVDEKIDIITKDADDLGDWLYNQFFKTIENQVINETKDEAIVTRRSDSSPTFVKKPTRRSHKYWRAKKKRKKKKKGHKSKLLRITEDDSLFDSSSDSTSGESSDSSDSSSSSSEVSDDKSKERKSDHGHKKIIVYNKRPKPPLPSFIFLPNMETPFFPPIGLPPPPIPMYPMVPVPPVMGPYPFPGQTTCQDEGDSTTSANARPDTEPTGTIGAITSLPTTVSDTTIITIPTKESGQETDLPDDNADVTTGTTIKDNLLRLRDRSKLHRGPRNKLMKKLRDKLKRKNKLQNYFVNEYQDPEPPVDVDEPPNCLPSPVPNRHKTFSNMEDRLPGLQDVDFKYLSQLIHLADLNKTNQRPPTEPPPIEVMKNIITLPPSNRRNYYNNSPNDIAQLLNDLASQPASQIPDQSTYYDPSKTSRNVQHRKKIEDTNDRYYATLGRQIASMIRNIEGDNDVDIEIEKSISNNPSLPVFNGNRGSRSYWERSVRSPFKIVNAYKKEMNNLKKSNENLYSLENKVAIAASTVPALSLRELENIIRKMERAKSKLIKINFGDNDVTESSKISFNVNLLPENDHSFDSNEKIKKKPYETQNKRHLYYNKGNTRRKNAQIPIQSELNNSLLTNFLFTLQKKIGNNTNKTVLERNIVSNMLPTRKPKTIVPRYKYPNKNVSSYAYTVLPLPMKPALISNKKLPFLQATTSKTHYHQLSPMVQNYKKLNYYYTGNNNQFLFQKTSTPIKFSTFSRLTDPFMTQSKPSYFHHELHHFDYFDDNF